MIDPAQFPAPGERGRRPQRLYRLPIVPKGGGDIKPSPPPPMFNLPPGVKFLILTLVVIHLGQHLMPFALNAQLEDMLGYFPYRYWLLLHGHWAGPLFLVITTPVTYMFLHANWVHLGVNVMSLAAFGSVVERLAGARMMVWLFLLCGVCGAFTEFAIDPAANTIVIGASAGISGLFAIALMAMARARTTPRRKLWGSIVMVLVVMMVMGRAGIMGMTVAWVSHIGGFMAGLVASSCLSGRDSQTPLRDLSWFAAIIALPLLVLVLNVSRYF
jgi:membrane associated rhomboid family serine protease